MKVKIINTSDNKLPAYETTGSAGMDLRANLKQAIHLQPRERVLVPTGLKIQLPEGYEAQVRPRSGLALKEGITVLNSPGTIDSDYTGDVGVILINHGKQAFIIQNGDRIAQLVFQKVEQAEFEVVDSLEETERGEGGFGSTGVKEKDNSEANMGAVSEDSRYIHYSNQVLEILKQRGIKVPYPAFGEIKQLFYELLNK